MEGAGVVALEPEAVFEGPEDRLNALADRRQVRPASGLGLALGSQDVCAVALGDGLGELCAGVALVADDGLAAVESDGEQTQCDVAFLLSAEARIAARGVPSGAARRCRRMPQNQRLWLRL